MSRLYGAQQRALQDRFDTRRIADKVEAVAIHSELSDMDKAFIESRDMFWLSTIDEQGRPTVSYKGGDPGFVKALDANTIVFPLYDGNGMFYSAGNIVGSGKVGMLFMDLERPNRLRLQGTATLSERDPLMAQFHEAQLLVRIAVDRGVAELPALRAPLPEGASLTVRAARGVRNAAGRVEAHRHAPGRSAGEGSGTGAEGGRSGHDRGVVRQGGPGQPGGLSMQSTALRGDLRWAVAAM